MILARDPDDRVRRGPDGDRDRLSLELVADMRDDGLRGESGGETIDADGVFGRPVRLPLFDCDCGLVAPGLVGIGASPDVVTVSTCLPSEEDARVLVLLLPAPFVPARDAGRNGVFVETVIPWVDAVYSLPN
jgi:hypothetical protein